MKRIALLIIIVVSFALGMSSCQQTNRNEVKQQSFKKLIENGRGVAALHSVTGEVGGLFLTSDPVISSQKPEKSDFASWIMYDISRMPSVAPKDLSDFALSFLNSRVDVFGLPIADLRKAERHEIVMGNKLKKLIYERFHNDIRVRDSRVEITFTKFEEGFKLREIASNCGGPIVLSNEGVKQTIFNEFIAETGFSNLTLLTEPTRIVLRKAKKFQEFEYFYATEFQVYLEEGDNAVTVTVIDGTNRPIEAFGTKMKGSTYQAQSYGFIQSQPADGKASLRPLRFGTVLSGSETAGADSEGLVDLVTPSGAASMKLVGPRAAVYDYSNKNNDLDAGFVADSPSNAVTIPATVQGGFINGSDIPASYSLMNAFLVVNDLLHVAKRYVTADEYPILKRQIPIRGNVTPVECNGFWSGGVQLIVVYPDGDECYSLASINSGIAHELGHGIDDFTGIAKVESTHPKLGKYNYGIVDGSFAEGFADAVAAYYTGQPFMSLGIEKADPAKYFRTSKNTSKFPDDVSGEIYKDSEIVSGAFWDVREGLIEKYGNERGIYEAENLLFRQIMFADYYTDVYRVYLQLDDTDGNPATQSPNYCIINKAFANHGLAEPDSNCEGGDTVSQILTDNSIFVRVDAVAEDGKTTNLLVAGSELVSIKGCFGDKVLCIAEQKSDIQFRNIGYQDGNYIFESVGSVPMEDQKTITILSYGFYGELVATRTVRFYVP